MDEDTDDARLVRAAQDGDKEAFALLLTRHLTLLVSLCRRVLRDDDAAQDVAQEAALQAYLSLDRLKHAGRFGPWLGGIGLNLCRHRLRRRQPDLTSSDALDGGRHDPLRDLPDEEVGPDERAELLDLRVRVQRAVAELPRGQRAAVALFYLHGFSHAETATQLGIEVGAVKTRLHKARGTLRETLWELWEEQDVTTTTTDTALVRVRIDTVRKNYKTGQSAIILKEVDEREEVERSRGLFVWVGEVEAEALGRTLRKEETPRPLTYTLMANLLHAGDLRVREVQIHTLADEVFYAAIVVVGPAGMQRVYARPSDALNLAAIVDAPVSVARAVLDANGVAWLRRTTRDEHGREDVEEMGYGPDGQQTYHIRWRTIRDESGRDVIENTSFDVSGKETNRLLFDPQTKETIDVTAGPTGQAATDDVS